MVTERPLFTSLRCGFIYGPMQSRPLGRALGINLLPPGQKTCTFNCAWCPYGWTPSRALDFSERDWPTTTQIVGALEDWLIRAARRNERIDRLLLAGHGEPTLHPRFPAMVAAVADVRRRLAPHVRLAVLSNATTARDPAIRAALTCLDDRFIKLDAKPATCQRHRDADSVELDVADGLRAVEDITIRSIFVADGHQEADNSSDAAVVPWLRTIGAIWPRAVHVCTLEGPVASPWLEKVSRTRLNEIARDVRRLGIDAEAFA